MYQIGTHSDILVGMSHRHPCRSAVGLRMQQQRYTCSSAAAAFVAVTHSHWIKTILRSPNLGKMVQIAVRACRTYTPQSAVSKEQWGIAMDVYIIEILAKTQPRSATFMHIFRTWRDLWHRSSSWPSVMGALDLNPV